MTFKHWLWKIGLKKTCPRCDSKLWEVGYPNDFDFSQRYKCSNSKCKFGKE